MGIEKFEDVIAWQKDKEVILALYDIFKGNSDFSFKDQILRAAVSITNNIAEGFERKGDKELKYFLYVTKGSAGEVRSMLYIAKELEYIDEFAFDDLYNKIIEVSKLLSGFIKKI